MDGSPARRYGKPPVVAVSLGLLGGPTAGVILLPRHLDWSGLASPEDQYAYLDEATLKRLWSYLWLPPTLRSAWEDRFPQLAELSRLTAAG